MDGPVKACFIGNLVIDQNYIMYGIIIGELVIDQAKNGIVQCHASEVGIEQLFLT